jgi:hypothetical protein
MVRRFHTALCALVFLLASAPADAARQIVDLHTLDAYFALFAADSNVPWKPAAVRLETYTSAPVDLQVFAVDPGEVLTAGTTARPRAVNTRTLRAIAHWQFTPPGGYQFQSNEIEVPLGNREGFFVIEARRGNVGEQVWINRTRIGLLTQQTPGDLVLYATDLGTGRAFAHMRIALLVGRSFVTRYTDANGILRWSGTHPIFVLASWGSSYAFASPVPQAPLPATIVGVRTDSAVVHAGESVRVVGFARSHGTGALRPATGWIGVSARLGTMLIAQKNVRLDPAGAFTSSFVVPANARAGDYAVLAQAAGGVGAATIHVDADAGGLKLSVTSRCDGVCASNADVPLMIEALRQGRAASGATVQVSVVRSPHAGDGMDSDAVPWGIADWYDATVSTDGDGRAAIRIPHPTDGLASTYGVRVDSGGATADTRIVVPTAQATLRLTLDRDVVAVGAAVGFTVSAVDNADGSPLRGAAVSVQTLQGDSVGAQTLTLDAAGRAHGTVTGLALGTSTIVAQLQSNGAIAQDAGQVTVEPRLSSDRNDDSSSSVRLSLDREVYTDGAQILAVAGDPGAVGDALIMFESAWGTQTTVTPSSDGAARATFRATDAPGQLQIGAAFVRDGALEWNAVPVALDAPGRAVAGALTFNKPEYAPNETAGVQFAGGAPGTVVVRVTRGTPSGDAAFDSLAATLAVDVASTQSSAPAGVTWHAWVDSTGEHAQVVNYERRGSPPTDVTLAQADFQPIYWAVERTAGGPIPVPAPAQPGQYILSILKIGDDGRISAASSNLGVR